MNSDTRAKSDKKVRSALKSIAGLSKETPEHGLQVLQEEAALGNPLAMYHLVLEKLDTDPNPDFIGSIESLKKTAEAGYGPAAYTLMRVYRDGFLPPGMPADKILEPDLTEAEKWCDLAIKLREPNAFESKAFDLARAKKYSEALELIKNFPKKSETDEDADVYSGIKHSVSILKEEIKEKLKEEKGLAERFAVLNKKIEKGDADAMFILGSELVQGTAEQREVGLALLEKASAAGNHRAKAILKDCK